MDNKTKDAIRQLQAEIRQIQLSLAEHAGVEPAADATGERRQKDKSDAVVEYSVQYRSSNSEGPRIKSGAMQISATQISSVTNEHAAAIAYALSAPQKIALLRALLVKTSESSGALKDIVGLTTGSLYHHLRELMHADLIAQSTRNQYHITVRGARILLMLLALTAE